jgi:hypothetical protein
MAGKAGAEKRIAMRDYNADLDSLLHGFITRLRMVGDERMTGNELTSLQKQQLQACTFLQVDYSGGVRSRENEVDGSV